MTIAAYEALTEACVSFSARKQLQSEFAVGNREEQVSREKTSASARPRGHPGVRYNLSMVRLRLL